VKGEQGDIVVFAPQNALIITDLGSNINRMMKILREIDQPGAGEKVWIISLKHTGRDRDGAEAGRDLPGAASVKKRGGAARRRREPGERPKVGDLTAEMIISKIIPDERSNQLIVIATERSYARVKRMVEQLDSEISDSDGRIHVYYCENANCDELAQTLGAVTGVHGHVSAGGRPARSRARAPAPAPAPRAGGGGAGVGIQNLLFEGEVRINFDRPTNSLIVVSSLKDYQAVRRVIERLDSPRKQVFVEAMILEVTLDKQRDLGASFHGAKPQKLFGLDSDSLIVGGLNPSKTLFPVGALSETMLAGILGPVLTADEAKNLGALATSTVDIPSFGVLIKALQVNNDVDVLSNPHLLIMNNEDGEISVGSRVPFPVSTFGLGGGAAPGGAAPDPGLRRLGSFFPNVQREKVALELKLTPHVNEHDMIRLEVDEKISELAPGSSNLGPSTSERTAKTDRRRQGSADDPDRRPDVRQGDQQRHQDPAAGRHPDPGVLLPQLDEEDREDEPDHRAHAVRHQRHVGSAARAREEDAERREFVERFGAQERPIPQAQFDYRRKRGMLEEINRVAREIETEATSCSASAAQSQDESGPVELPVGRARRRVVPPHAAPRRRPPAAAAARAAEETRSGEEASR
jgi:general secretion pathway protein D